MFGILTTPEGYAFNLYLHFKERYERYRSPLPVCLVETQAGIEFGIPFPANTPHISDILEKLDALIPKGIAVSYEYELEHCGVGQYRHNHRYVFSSAPK